LGLRLLCASWRLGALLVGGLGDGAYEADGVC
jgi:hypothetical protein